MKKLWGRRLAFLLAVVMLAAEISVPLVSAETLPAVGAANQDIAVQSTDSEEQASEILEIPEEYQEIKLEGSKEVIDLSQPQENALTISDDMKASGFEPSREEYDSIPVIGKVDEPVAVPVEPELLQTENLTASEPEQIYYIDTTVEKAELAELESNVAADGEEGVAVSANTLITETLPDSADKEIYTFTAEEDGDYLVAVWSDSDSYMNIQIKVNSEFRYGPSWTEDFTYPLSNFKKGNICSIEIENPSADTVIYNLLIYKTDKIDETKTVVGTCGYFESGKGLNAYKVSVNSSKGYEYFATIDCGKPYSLADEPTLFINGQSKVYIWNRNLEEDTFTINLEETEIPKVELNNTDIANWQGPVNYGANYIEVKSDQNSDYSFSGTYGDMENVIYASYLYEKNDEGNLVLIPWKLSGSNARIMELNSEKNYFVCYYTYPTVTEASTATLKLTPVQEDTLSLGEEKNIQVTGQKCLSLTVPDVSSGFYRLQIQGDAEEYTVSVPSSPYWFDGKVTQANNGIRTIYIDSTYFTGDYPILIYPKEKGAALGKIFVSLKETDRSLELNNNGCWKETGITVDSADCYYRAFKPDKTGTYILASENRNGLSNQYGLRVNVNEKSAGLVKQEYYHDISDFALSVELEEGKEYIFSINLSTWGDNNSYKSETLDLILCEDSSKELSGAELTSTDVINKCIIYRIDFPKSGLYTLGVSGSDTRYLVKTQEFDNINNVYIYKDKPRTFMVESAGTYDIMIMKEFMTEEKDNISFFCRSEASVNQVQPGGSDKKITVTKDEGAWITFTPEKTGWYMMNVMNNEDVYLYGRQYIISEDGTELVSNSYLNCVRRTDQERSYVIKGRAGQTSYIKISFDEYETIDKLEVDVSISQAAATYEIAKTGQTEIPLSNHKLFSFTTDFEEKTYLEFGIGEDIELDIADISENQDTLDFDYWISSGDLFSVPAGKHTYLVYQNGTAASSITISPKVMENVSDSTVQIKFISGGKKVEWVKFTPQENALYMVYTKNKDFSSDICLYEDRNDSLYSIRSISDTDKNNQDYQLAYLNGGQSYFIKTECYDTPASNKNFTAELGVSKLKSDDIQMEEINTISFERMAVVNNPVKDNGYYEISVPQGNAPVYMQWFSYSKKKNRIIYNTGSKQLITDEKTIVFLDGWKTSGENTYIRLFRDEENAEAANISFTIKSAVSNEQIPINYQEEYKQEAEDSIKKYSFTPETDGYYTFIIQSDDYVSTYEFNAELLETATKKVIRRADWSNDNPNRYNGGYRCRYAAVYKLTAGKQYSFYVPETEKFSLKVDRTDTKILFDYDIYNAFIASGGTVGIVSSYDEIPEYDTCNYELETSRLDPETIIYFSTKDFKNPNDIWVPSDKLFMNVKPYDLYLNNINYSYFGDEELTYQSIKAELEQPKSYYASRYKITNYYYVDKNETQNLAKNIEINNLSAPITSGQKILLVKTAPKTVLVNSITLTGVTTLEVGNTAKLTANVSSGNQYTITNPAVAYTSSNPAVLTVAADGTVTAKGAGTATVTCSSKDGNAKATISITVKEGFKVGAETETKDGSFTVINAGSGKAQAEYTVPASDSTKTVIIPDTVIIGGVECKVTKVANEAFKNNKTISSVTIGKNVTEIGKEAFSGCTKLKKVIIQKNVTKIGKGAFKNCKSLKTIVINTTKLKKIEKDAFKGIKKNATIKVPKKQLKKYTKLLKKSGLPDTVKIKGV